MTEPLLPERVLEFPEDLVVGRLWMKTGDSVVGSGPARGTVRVRAGVCVGLSAGCPVRGLGGLQPDALDEIDLPKKSPTDEDVRRIAHLTGLRSVYMSKARRMTDAGLGALAGLS
jgi:hypothetical protein